jgi:hypothetical protein
VKPKRHLCAWLTAVLAAAAFWVNADDPPPAISGRITDDCDGLVPMGGPVTFELADLRYTVNGAPAEYPVPTPGRSSGRLISRPGS